MDIFDWIIENIIFVGIAIGFLYTFFRGIAGSGDAEDSTEPKKPSAWKKMMDEINKELNPDSASASAPPLKPKVVVQPVQDPRVDENSRRMPSQSLENDLQVRSAKRAAQESVPSFQIEHSELQRAVVMAEILGKPRAYKKRIR